MTAPLQSSTLFRKKGLRSTFLSKEMLQNLPYLYKKKTHVFFFILHFEELVIDKGIHKIKMKVAEKEKRKKLRGFSFSINMANFEVFHWTKKLISDLFFLKSAYVHFCII